LIFISGVLAPRGQDTKTSLYPYIDEVVVVGLALQHHSFPHHPHKTRSRMAVCSTDATTVPRPSARTTLLTSVIGKRDALKSTPSSGKA
jgi:hypothetical protein